MIRLIVALLLIIFLVIGVRVLMHDTKKRENMESTPEKHLRYGSDMFQIGDVDDKRISNICNSNNVLYPLTGLSVNYGNRLPGIGEVRCTQFLVSP